MRFMQKAPLLLTVACGALLSLAFAPFNLWPLAIVCPSYLFLTWQGAAPRRAALMGFLFTSGTFLAGTYWLYHSVYVIGRAPIAIALSLMLALVVIMGLYGAFLGYVQARWFPRRGYGRYVVALPAGWVLVEWLRGWLFSGFPWLSIGYSGIGSPLAQFAPIGGVYSVSWAMAVLGGAVALFVSSSLLSGERRMRVIAIVTAAVVLASAYSFKAVTWTSESGTPVSVALVQGAVPQDMKWTREQYQTTLGLYRELTLPHLGTQLIVWPESALPDVAESLSGYLEEISHQATARGSHLLLGVQHYDAEAASVYNSVLALGDPPQWYNKRHLVPFGEYFPVPQSVRSWMRMMSLPYADFTAGDDRQAPLSAGGQKIAVTICYEDAYGSAQLAYLKEVTILVNVTNDAWFGDSTARHQHLQISRMRAMEAGRPLLRVANDGISSIIEADGAIVSQLPSFKPGVLAGFVQPRVGLTPYAHVGNFAIVLLCVVLACAGIVRRSV